MNPAFLNWGRWKVHCPSPVCLGAALVEPGQTSVICQCRDEGVCQHGPVCGAIYRVAWPAEASTIELIEEAVSVRPLQNRNWFPHETVADLHRENVENGVI